MADFRPLIANDLLKAPAWTQSYRRLKVVIDRMVADGEVERVRPPEGRARNMIALTAKGRAKYQTGGDL